MQSDDVLSDSSVVIRVSDVKDDEEQVEAREQRVRQTKIAIRRKIRIILKEKREEQEKMNTEWSRKRKGREERGGGEN